jgi:hypothetical protein
LLNALPPIESTDEGIFKFPDKLLQFKKAKARIVFSEEGICIEPEILEQP